MFLVKICLNGIHVAQQLYEKYSCLVILLSYIDKVLAYVQCKWYKLTCIYTTCMYTLKEINVYYIVSIP